MFLAPWPVRVERSLVNFPGFILTIFLFSVSVIQSVEGYCKHYHRKVMRSRSFAFKTPTVLTILTDCSITVKLNANISASQSSEGTIFVISAS